MNFIEFLHTKGEWFQQYNWQHLLTMGLFVAAAILAIYFVPKMSSKAFRIALFVAWCVFILFEIGKQIYFYTENDPYYYQWYIFPYQFCSTPFFVLPLAIFLKDGKIRDASFAYLSSYSFFAGTIVFFFFMDGCFIDGIFINIQTMVHHGLMFLVGIAVAAHEASKFSFRNFLKGSCLFAILSGIAIVLNEILYPYVSSIGGQMANLFYINYHYPSTLAVIGSLWQGNEGLPKYILFLAVYLLGFVACAFIFYMILLIPIRLVQKKRQH